MALYLSHLSPNPPLKRGKLSPEVGGALIQDKCENFESNYGIIKEVNRNERVKAELFSLASPSHIGLPFIHIFFV
jgi:hypothetical protein